MLRELSDLLSIVPADASTADYRSAIVDQNVLAKPSTSTRSKTYSYLRDRYGLDPDIPTFALLRSLWPHDPAGRPLMSLLVALLRDPVMRSSASVILSTAHDRVVASPDFARAIDGAFPDKLGTKTLKSTSENMTSSFRQSGHLHCGRPCRRVRVEPTPGSVTIALLFASFEDRSGQALFESDWVGLLDATPASLLSEAQTASARGWLELRVAGEVVDISFHRLFATLGVPE